MTNDNSSERRAVLLDGKAVAAGVTARVAAEAAELRAKGVQPGLAVVLVGEDPADSIRSSITCPNRPPSPSF